MSKYVRVENDQVVECLDYLPERPGDWREAIEVAPPLVQFKQIYGSHHFDLTKTPVEIVWSVIDLTLNERKETITNIVCSTLQQKLMQETSKTLTYGEFMNVEYINYLSRQLQDLKMTILNLKTHEQIDAYIAENNIVP